jgi:DNA polymerase III delta subunit
MPAAKAKPVYALVGSDAFLQLQKLAEILRLMPADVQRVDVEGERAELAEVLDELRSFAMFGGAKLVVVRDADDFISRFRTQLEDYCAAPSDSGTLVLRLTSLPKGQRIYKAIDRLGGVEACDPPKDIARWAAERAKSAHGITLAPDAARMLAELIGDDLGRIDSELAKLAIDAEGSKAPVTLEQVTAGITFQREQEMWDLGNALAAGDAHEALRRWRHMIQLDPSTEFRAITWLGMWLEDVAAVLHGAQGKVAWKYKERLPQLIKTSKDLGPAGYRRALDLLAEIDHQSKSGVGDAASNVERFILDVGTHAARAS